LAAHSLNKLNIDQYNPELDNPAISSDGQMMGLNAMIHMSNSNILTYV
jgi:hypothetical protein